MQRRTKQTRGPNKAEREFQGWLKERSCCVSGEYGVEVHHIYGSAFKHNKKLIGHWACIPLAPRYHRGDRGVHTMATREWTLLFGNQAEKWDRLYKEYREETGDDPCPGEVRVAIMDWGR